MKKLNFRDASISNLYQLNGLVPVHKAIPFGLQHILAMFVANIAPILIVGGACGLASSETAMLIQSAMLIAGIGTLIQLFPIFHKVGSGNDTYQRIEAAFQTCCKAQSGEAADTRSLPEEQTATAGRSAKQRAASGNRFYLSVGRTCSHCRTGRENEDSAFAHF